MNKYHDAMKKIVEGCMERNYTDVDWPWAFSIILGVDDSIRMHSRIEVKQDAINDMTERLVVFLLDGKE